MKFRLPPFLSARGARPDKVAGYWFVRLQSPRANVQDWRRFELWRAQSPENAAAYDRLESFWVAAAGAADIHEVQELRKAACIERPARRLHLSTAVAIAASLAVVILGGLLVQQPNGTKVLVVTAQQWLASRTDNGRFATAIGERSTVRLHDDSVITLDTNSEVRVEYTPTERMIHLTRGQVMFEVARDKARPFTVQAGDRRVMALGTAFTVRLDDAAVSVSLVEGNVVVAQISDRKSGVSRALTTLQPGERLVAKAGGPVSITTADIEQVTSWRSGKVIFLDTTLADAVNELNRYSKDQILIVDNSLADLRVNGVFRTGRLLDFARSVASVYPVTIDQARSGQIRIVAATAR